MNRRSLLSLSTITAISFALLPGSTVAQQKSLKDQLVGMWALVSAENTSPSGTKSYPFGPNPRGIVVLDGNGRFVVLNMSSTLPKVASNNRASATPEETKAIVSQSLGLYGTWSVNEAEKALVWHIEASTFENWVGQEQKRPIRSVTADEVTWINPTASTGVGNSTVLVWKRIK